MTEKWVVVVKLDGETAKGEVYNNFVTGEDVTFTDLEAAEKFAAKIEGEGRRMQATVEPLDNHVNTKRVFDYSFVATLEANRASQN
ncbi:MULTISPECIES: hypothetical protein [Bacillus]|uniref:hypothetical protein n=1 Tax=Bacillus TaxID=1386 RepID=UPI0006173549|nr:MULTISPECIES: hypothetical protein [Bacillus]ATH91697.1 hypothetical protein COP00_02965 [Bacillus glycinifermentans]KKB71890.1 hypothetical protein TH62_20010 [Bacillus sp. TH008]NUJ16757.1 hypothetical protein [Bacillus glycinifermentans]